MAGFDSLMLTSTETISFMEGAAAGRMKETERDGRLICLPSVLHRPLLVLVGAMVTTGGVPQTPWPRVWPRRGPNEPLLGVVTGEL